MNENEMTLGTNYPQNRFGGPSVIGWHCSEKYDGVRAFWDGERMWSRGGFEITPPPWFNLPRGQKLDGEIWCGRGRFQEARVAVQHGGDWSNARFIAFDAPDAPGTWTERVATIPAALRIEYTTINTRGEFCDAFRAVKALGGEGLMLRHPTARGYETGRTSRLLKVKHL